MAYKNANTINVQINKAVSDKMESAVNKAMDAKYANTIKDRIVKRTQLGIGVDPKSKRGFPLKPLSESYKEQRQGKYRWYTTKDGRKVKYPSNKGPTLAGTTQPAKSNLTATGQLLKALSTVKLRAQKGKVIWAIIIGDNRGRDMWGKSSKIGNKTLVTYLQQQGRYFLDLTLAQRNEISREIRQRIRKFIK